MSRDDDAGHVPDAPSSPDASFVPVDAAAGGLDCAAMRVSEELCGPVCDGPDRWYWDGERCTQVDCGRCVGPDCDLGVLSESECRAAHATCVPELCRSTGGEWLFWASECGHFECGHAPPATCLVGAPVCDCGPDSVFLEGEGCVASDGCVGDPAPPEELCNRTGGRWENVCCHSSCGQPCLAACLAPACTCGPLQIFDERRGCLDAAQCRDNRAEGQSCTSDAPMLRCRDGLACCEACGVVGCDSVCLAPRCDGGDDACGDPAP